ncbi:hypothetical protein TSA6c_17460 [Azospirillum sp. TSA6c]|uniref:hypothetical protein n=1 Tax=Azospirillum sp. TSA6c TaxID=709813 RepID=UPI000D60FA15|nr:hypothetical protein [Azospirillum sp. TSA6c]PWC48209.1 hypothetical protein TSA6c_17460 [Azospirillum sp. TSA6c]
MDLFDFARARAGETITHTLATDQPKARRSPRRIRTLDEMLTDPSTWQPQRWSDAKKTSFLREATRQLKAAAKVIGISAGDIRVLVAEASQSAPGMVSLFSPTLHIRVSISPYL